MSRLPLDFAGGCRPEVGRLPRESLRHSISMTLCATALRRPKATPMPRRPLSKTDRCGHFRFRAYQETLTDVSACLLIEDTNITAAHPAG